MLDSCRRVWCREAFMGCLVTRCQRERQALGNFAAVPSTSSLPRSREARLPQRVYESRGDAHAARRSEITTRLDAGRDGSRFTRRDGPQHWVVQVPFTGHTTSTSACEAYNPCANPCGRCSTEDRPSSRTAAQERVVDRQMDRLLTLPQIAQRAAIDTDSCAAHCTPGEGAPSKPCCCIAYCDSRAVRHALCLCQQH